MKSRTRETLGRQKTWVLLASAALLTGIVLGCQAREEPTESVGKPAPVTAPEPVTPEDTVTSEPGSTAGAPAADAEFTLSSSAFSDGGDIPRKYTGEGEDVSPPLNWTDPPEGTRGFALICEDPDAPAGPWVHWAIYGIPADARGLPEGLPAALTLDNGMLQGRNGFGNAGYGGPMPPKGAAHRYFFKLYALSEPISLPAGAWKRQLVNAMEGTILAEAQLMGRYQR
jgi:Raf kinase inhibitor-like YbhB/YbcL family protein